MPRYYFHLRHGARTWPDEEGVELDSRSAARAEASAIIHDLSHPTAATASSRRWAGWFLRVADDGGSFVSLPIGQPALEVVTADWAARPVEPTGPGPTHDKVAGLMQEFKTARQDIARLLERSQRLREELAADFVALTGTRLEARELLARLKANAAGALPSGTSAAQH